MYVEQIHSASAIDFLRNPKVNTDFDDKYCIEDDKSERKVANMRIDAYNQINQIYGVNKTKKAGKTGRGSSAVTDQVSFSSVGRDMQVAKTALANVPDVRQEKIDAIKSSIQNGTYNVSNESFAERLVSVYQNRFL